MATVKVTGLVKSFQSGPAAVDSISFDVGHGELVTLLGPSGCGKTTTLRLIAGLEVPDGGQIAFDDQVVSATQQGLFVPPERRGAGMVFQSYAIWPHMTVYGNVAYPLRMRREKGLDIQSRVEATLDSVGLLDFKNRLATQLSGGQQQRTAIARAIVGTPSLLLFDEPLSNLDAMLRARMRVELRQLQQRLKITTIYVTHDQVEAMVLADRVIVMHGGRIQQIGPPREVYMQPSNRFVAEFVGFNNFMTGTIAGRDNDGCHVRLFDDGPVIHCYSNTHASVGDEVVLATRASYVDIHSKPLDDATNVVAGQVVETIYLGETTEYRVQAGPLTLIASQNERAVLDQSGTRAAVGDTVWLRLAPRSLVALPTNREV